MRCAYSRTRPPSCRDGTESCAGIILGSSLPRSRLSPFQESCCTGPPRRSCCRRSARKTRSLSMLCGCANGTAFRRSTSPRSAVFKGCTTVCSEKRPNECVSPAATLRPKACPRPARRRLGTTTSVPRILSCRCPNNVPSGKVWHDIRGEEFAAVSVFASIAIDQQVDSRLSLYRSLLRSCPPMHPFAAVTGRARRCLLNRRDGRARVPGRPRALVARERSDRPAVQQRGSMMSAWHPWVRTPAGGRPRHGEVDRAVCGGHVGRGLGPTTTAVPYGRCAPVRVAYRHPAISLLCHGIDCGGSQPARRGL